MRFTSSLFLFLFTILSLAGQSSRTDKYDFRLTSGDLQQCLDQLERLSEDFTLAYSPDMISKASLVSGKSWKNGSIDSIISHILKGSDLDYRWVGSTIVFSKKRIKTYQLHGVIKDAETRDIVPHAIVQTSSTTVRADEYGHYTILLAEGQHTVYYSSLGYATKQMELQITSNQKADIGLAFDNEIQEVIIRSDSIKRPSYHYEHYGYKYLEHLTQHAPGIGGTRDIMHTVRALPGVQSGSGGIGGHYVRGSQNGGNLYLLDDVPVYYPYHAFGVSSIFDPSFIRDVQFYKSGHRARYAGRAASVMDVHIKQGNQSQWGARAAGSLESASLMAQGPVLSQSSLLAYGRVSTRGAIYNRIISNTILMDEAPEASFSDVLVKYGHQLAPRHHFSATYFTSGDGIHSDYEAEWPSTESILSDLDWRTSTLTAQIRSSLSPSTLLSVRGYRSIFDTEYEELITTNADTIQSEYYLAIGSRIDDTGVSAIIDHHSNTLGDIQLGWRTVRHDLNPSVEYLNEGEIMEQIGDQKPTLDNLSPTVVDEIGAISHSLWVEQRAAIGRWTGDLGLHLSAFSHEGTTYRHLQPRANVSYKHPQGVKLTASVSKMVQYMHLLPYSSINLPRDIWYPSGDRLLPEEVWHYDLGAHTSYAGVDIDANVYYKSTSNLIIHDADQVGLDQIDPVEAFLQGSGTSYGAEINISKKYERIRGNIAYAYSIADRDIPGFNQDRTFAFQFDRRHELKMMGAYMFSPAWSLGASLYAGSPHPKLFSGGTSLGAGINQIDSSDQGTKNSQRAKSVFRLDLSMLYQINRSGLHHSLKVGVYNMTNSQNPMLHLVSGPLVNSEPGFSIPFSPFVQYSISF